jgi:hypothetical protein
MIYLVLLCNEVFVDAVCCMRFKRTQGALLFAQRIETKSGACVDIPTESLDVEFWSSIMTVLNAEFG